MRQMIAKGFQPFLENVATDNKRMRSLGIATKDRAQFVEYAKAWSGKGEDLVAQREARTDKHAREQYVPVRADVSANSEGTYAEFGKFIHELGSMLPSQTASHP